MAQTKAVAFRVPFDEYMKLVDEASQRNLSLADYVLSIFYSKRERSGEYVQLSERVSSLEKELAQLKVSLNY